MRSIADDLLPPCTVQIAVRGKHSGSGFFVTPHAVATCAHVVESPTDPAAPIDATDIRVTDAEGHKHEVDVHSFAPKPGSDLAVLKLPGAVEHTCVLLDPTPLLARDDVHTFAYPTDHPEGVPRPLVADGRTGAQQWALGRGQVQRGMSGAPLLSLRTGGVCGVVNRTRSRNTDLGGYAVPIAELLTLDKAVGAENEAYHQPVSEWLTALTSEQRTGWDARRAAAASGVRHFMVTLDETTEGWQVTADDPRDAEVKPEPVDLNAVKSLVARLFRDWASLHGRVDEEEQVMLLGRILFSAAFPGPIGERLVDLMRTGESERLLVSLRLDPDLDREFRELPWEHLYLPEPNDVYLATDSRVSFARVPGMQPGDELPPPASAPLSVVFAGVRPTEAEAGTTPAERLRDGLQRLAEKPPALDLEPPLLDPDAGVLDSELRDRMPDVLHYVGFGRLRNGVDQIALGAGPGDLDFLPVDALADLLPDPAPPLVVLEQCSASPPPVATDFSALAPALLDCGVAAVVAFQYVVSAPHTKLFNDAFYRALLAGDLVEFAVHAGRARVQQYRRSFVSPALFVRRPGELRLVTPSTGPAEQRRGAFTTVDA